MIKFPYKYKKGSLEIDFNWNQSVVPCKQVKITLGKKEKILSREEFSCLMAVFADDNQMENILQTTREEFVSVERMLKIKTKKDLKSGEYVVFPYVYWIPKREYDRLKADGEMIKIVEDDKKSLIKYISENEAIKEVKQMLLHGQLSKVEDLPA